MHFCYILYIVYCLNHINCQTAQKFSSLGLWAWKWWYVTWLLKFSPFNLNDIWFHFVVNNSHACSHSFFSIFINKIWFQLDCFPSIIHPAWCIFMFLPFKHPKSIHIHFKTEKGKRSIMFYSYFDCNKHDISLYKRRVLPLRPFSYAGCYLGLCRYLYIWTRRRLHSWRTSQSLCNLGD